MLVARRNTEEFLRFTDPDEPTFKSGDLYSSLFVRYFAQVLHRAAGCEEWWKQTSKLIPKMGRGYKFHELHYDHLTQGIDKSYYKIVEIVDLYREIYGINSGEDETEQEDTEKDKSKEEETTFRDYLDNIDDMIAAFEKEKNKKINQKIILKADSIQEIETDPEVKDDMEDDNIEIKSSQKVWSLNKLGMLYGIGLASPGNETSRVQDETILCPAVHPNCNNRKATKSLLIDPKNKEKNSSFIKTMLEDQTYTWSATTVMAVPYKVEETVLNIHPFKSTRMLDTLEHTVKQSKNDIPTPFAGNPHAYPVEIDDVIDLFNVLSVSKLMIFSSIRKYPKPEYLEHSRISSSRNFRILEILRKKKISNIRKNHDIEYFEHSRKSLIR